MLFPSCAAVMLWTLSLFLLVLIIVVLFVGLVAHGFAHVVRESSADSVLPSRGGAGPIRRARKAAAPARPAPAAAKKKFLQSQVTVRRAMLTIQIPPLLPEGSDELALFYTNLSAKFLTVRHHSAVIFQLEKAPTTGQLHIQAYQEYSSPIKFATIKTTFPTAHIEKAFKDSGTCQAYCSKEETKVAGYDTVRLGVFSKGTILSYLESRGDYGYYHPSPLHLDGDY